jgi:membrane-associated phospholipid phosphatase
LTPEIDSVNSFDNFVMSLMAEYSQKSVALNKIIVQLFDYYTIKIVPVFFCVWLLWFGSKAEKYRPAIVRALLGMLFAVFVSRSIQDFLPERLRPLNAGDPHFIPPLGVHIDEMEHWSSFPSDHAALFFAFSTALWLTSRTFGALGYAWSVFIICIPRIYSGRHYASDVVAGAAIGGCGYAAFGTPHLNQSDAVGAPRGGEIQSPVLRIVLCHLIPVLHNVRRHQAHWQCSQEILLGNILNFLD